MRFQRGAVGEQSREALPDQRARAGAEQVLGRRVGVAHDVAVVEHHDRRGEQVQPANAAAMGWVGAAMGPRRLSAKDCRARA